MPRLLVINPNTTASITALAARHVRAAVGEDFEIVTATAEFGCAYIASGSLPGQGFHSFPLPIPNTAALQGLRLYAQTFHDEGTALAASSLAELTVL